MSLKRKRSDTDSSVTTPAKISRVEIQKDETKAATNNGQGATGNEKKMTPSKKASSKGSQSASTSQSLATKSPSAQQDKGKVRDILAEPIKKYTVAEVRQLEVSVNDNEANMNNIATLITLLSPEAISVSGEDVTLAASQSLRRLFRQLALAGQLPATGVDPKATQVRDYRLDCAIAVLSNPHRLHFLSLDLLYITHSLTLPFCFFLSRISNVFKHGC